MSRLARMTWVSMWDTAPVMLMPIGEKSDAGMAHMARQAIVPALKERKKAGEKREPEISEPMSTLLTTTKSAQGPPK